MEERITELEIRLSQLDQSVLELSDSMFAQQKLIDRLAQTCEELRQRIQAAAEAPAAGEPGDEKPPHY